MNSFALKDFFVVTASSFEIGASSTRSICRNYRENIIYACVLPYLTNIADFEHVLVVECLLRL